MKHTDLEFELETPQIFILTILVFVG